MTDTVSGEACELHRQVMEEKIKALGSRVDACEKQTFTIFDELREIRALQRQMLYTVIFIAVGVCLTLLGVLIGRGVDFGWVVASP